MNSWLEGRNWIGKGAQSTGVTASLRILSSKPIQTLGRASIWVNWSWSQCIKSHHVQTSSGKGLPSHFWNRNNVRNILPGLRRKDLDCCSVVQNKSIFCISFRNQGLEEDWTGTESKLLEVQCEVPKSMMIWSDVTSASVGPLCFNKSKIDAAIYQEI